jgi:hypothetical protein
MNTSYLLPIFFILTHSSCLPQPRERSEAKFKFDVMKNINPNYINLTRSVLKQNDITKEMVIPFYEFDVTDLSDMGDAVLFGLSKTFPENWVKQASTGDCKNTNTRMAILCQAKKLFSSDTAILRSELDLYIVFVDIKELEGPFLEEAEGGTSYNYYPKKGCTYIVYQYEPGGWKEIERVKRENDVSIRFFGINYLKQLAMKRMKN